MRVNSAYEHDSPASRLLVLMLSIYFVFSALLFLTALLLIWPGMEQFSRTAALPSDVRLLLIALCAAGLGSVINATTSFVDYVGNRRLFRSWGLWYLFRPIIGLATGLVVYIAIRGGILKADTTVDVLNPYTVVALAAAAGFLSKQIVDKLNDYGNTVGRTKAVIPPPQTFRLSAPNITDIEPSSGPISGRIAVTITGSNFVDGSRVFFDGSPVVSTSVDSGGSNISILTPPGEEGPVNVEVVNPDGQKSHPPMKFIYR